MGENENKVPLHAEPKRWKPPKGPKPIAHKSKNKVGLGRSIANQRRQENIVEFLPDGEMRFTTDKRESKASKLKSVTQESALDEFLGTAELADKDFTAEKRQQMKIITVGDNQVGTPHGLLTQEEAENIGKKHKKFANELIIPRRPAWHKEQLKFEIERQEKTAFLDWRRQLAMLSENHDLLLTPFERNLEVWRQLWRVVERCDLLVQIVDARNPLSFRSIDLEKYVNELSQPDLNAAKTNLLLVNKADLLTKEQRHLWADFFNANGINYAFFSAAKANELLEKERQEFVENPDSQEISSYENEEDAISKVRILRVDELENLFVEAAPKNNKNEKEADQRFEIGLVGYPNVGKSSTINALVGSKKVSVSATPGKTKHFQTIILSSKVVLCDCPGLVFPNFAFTKAELVCNGILPIDQIREYIPPVSIVSERIPKYYLEAFYAIRIPSEESANDDYVSARELLDAYAKTKGYMTQGYGKPDQSRASRYILKDYVNGKLLFVNSPPKKVGDGDLYDYPSLEEAREMNKDLYTFRTLPKSRKTHILEALSARDINIDEYDLSKDMSKLSTSVSSKKESMPLQEVTNEETLDSKSAKDSSLNASDDLDREFFMMNDVKANVNNRYANKVPAQNTSKKHFKKNKREAKKKRVTY